MIIAVLFLLTAFVILTKDYTSDKDLKSSDLVKIKFFFFIKYIKKTFIITKKTRF